MKKVNVAIVGATGMVGRTFLKILKERNFPIENLYLLASKKSAGDVINFNGKDYIIEELTENSFDKDIDIALFSAGGEISKKFAPIAKEKGVIVVDNSSMWRMHADVPLVVPEVNPEDVKKHNGIIANPNCSTIQAVVPLKNLHDKFGIKRVVYSTYQAVSGSGVKGISDLTEGIKGNENKLYPHPIAYNALPHIDVFMDNGYTKEEMKMINETKKILNDHTIKITATTVRIPVMYSHSESVNVEFEKEFDLKEVFDVLNATDGVVVVDDPKNNEYPLALDAEGKDEVFVGRIRRDFSLDNGINMWVVADNIRKGAATNTVQIAELLLKYNLV
ncbi:aspartate-semialdehyde dehydrogenase [Tepidibacter aestuarii]|uniref:aspartate-semialdehyde dehydrogenase n=1 Tax=Tepidibacter aestuarii TaxID=2925782 RepID=UPI0020BF9EAF|nr:aspartate-semialdehyde dehydrogenase [Tepidibacter aestuarii]CAH2214431.1 aspartate-semialdehyde dehydrogenase [Tepidibacter aestuarii]